MAAQAPRMTELSMVLMELFGDGSLTGTQVQRIAAAAWSDNWGRRCPLASSLVKAGHYGKYSGNIVRDLIFAASSHDLLASVSRPYDVLTPDGKTCQVFLPHEVVLRLHEKLPTSAWGLPQEELDKEFGLGWTLKQWKDHPAVQFHGPLGQVWVLGFHCDGVSYSGIRAGAQKSAVVLSLNVISCQDERLRVQRHPLCVLQKSNLCKCGQCNGYHTYQAVFEVMSWSFQCLLRGLTPDSRHDASPFSHLDLEARVPGRIWTPTACLLQVRGDWLWLCEAFRLRWFTSQAFCWKCNVTKDASGIQKAETINFDFTSVWVHASQNVSAAVFLMKDTYHDFSHNAPHRDTLITHDAYVGACIEEEQDLSTLFRAPGFCLEHICVDLMHAGDIG